MKKFFAVALMFVILGIVFVAVMAELFVIHPLLALVVFCAFIVALGHHLDYNDC